MSNFTKKAGLMLLLLLANLVGFAADGSFKDFSVIVNNQTGTLLTSEEQVQGTSINFGVAVADDGTVSRVAADDASSVATVSGKYHSDHGCTNLKVVVPVEGNVKITVGQCQFSTSEIKVTDSDGATVVTKTPAKPSCWKNDRSKVDELYYSGNATTLTISGMGYCAYVAVEKTDYVPEAHEIAFSVTDADVEGTAPDNVSWKEGDSFSLPVNHTLYKAGYTLTAWNDGTNDYVPGTAYTPTADVTFTPVFTQNTVSLADRTEEVTLNFDFQRKNGAPYLSYEGKPGIYVTQATVNGVSIDSKLDFTTSPGKVNNTAWTDWCQMNDGTTFTVPSAQNAVVSIESFSEMKTTTIDGQTDYTSGTVISYNVASKADSIDVVIHDGTYFRYIKVVLPVVAPSGKTYTNEATTVEFPFAGNTTDPATITPEDAISLAAFAAGSDFEEGSGSADNIAFATFKPVGGQTSAAGESNKLEWSVKPAKGLTFTATKVSANVRRFGTDGGNIDVKVVNEEGKEVTLATGLIPRRNNKTMDTDAKAGNENLVESFSLDVPDSLATTEGFKLVCYLYNLGTTKTAGFNDVKIEGTVSGTIESVEKYAFSAVASPAEGGKVNIYPAGDEFEAGTELTLTATKNFGYKFVNWTDADGNVVSTDAKFKYTLNAAASLTANFEKINTYSLTYNVEGGAKSYMVQPDVAPTVVDGKNMYEEGTKVTLTASSNDILTFTNWSTGETSAEISLDMTEDKTVTANYSAIDFVAAWDFYLKGNNGRTADFAAEDNDADQLVLRDSDGNTYGWLDKSYENGGYEGRPGGVNWKDGAAIGTYYWQIKVNAQNFTDVKVKSAMVYNYNAYKTYLVEYSLNDSTWTTLGKIEMPGVKNWTDSELDLPADANNQSAVYIRWIADKTSDIDGTSSEKDGNCIGAIYVLGTPKIYDDGTAPKLVSTVPVAGATNASANGRVVLTFDEKVQLKADTKATLGTETLDGTAVGKVVTFPYRNLEYATEYTFTLPANTVSDLAGNTLTDAVTLTFTTMAKPTVTKALYDFVIPDDGTFREAITAANSRADKSVRYRIFVKKGTYVVPTDPNSQVSGSDGKSYNSVTTFLTANNVSLIGENMDSTVIKNDVPYDLVAGQWGSACPIEGIGKCDLMQISGSNTYLQDITLRNGTDDATGRNLAVQDKGDKTIYKNVELYGYQDTWTSNGDNSRYYFEDGVIRGRTDYICGKGDAFFNRVTFSTLAGGYIAVPSRPKQYGWILSECTIKDDGTGADGNYTLGRPWGSGTPIALWINTTMVAQPSAIGWNEMSGGWPARFAEYNSMTASGTPIDLSGRKTTFGDGHTNNPVLTAEEAAQYTIETVMGSTDNWDPQALTEQASAPEEVEIAGDTLTWKDSNYALLWAVCKNGSVVAFTTEPVYTVDDNTAVWSVRAANEMGGLGEATVAKVATGISSLQHNASDVVSTKIYSLNGQQLSAPVKGVNIIVSTKADGTTETHKVVVR